jgi:hypothetical protein
MPNWTSNEVRFKSRINSQKQLDKLKKRLEGKEEDLNKFDFNRIIKMPTALVNTKALEDKTDNKAKRMLKKYGAKDWYDWRNKNWGTKWNSVDTEITQDEREGLTYTFNTAWDCPREIVFKLQCILDEELPFISIQSWDCIHEDGQEEEQII